MEASTDAASNALRTILAHYLGHVALNCPRDGHAYSGSIDAKKPVELPPLAKESRPHPEMHEFATLLFDMSAEHRAGYDLCMQILSEEATKINQKRLQAQEERAKEALENLKKAREKAAKKQQQERLAQREAVKQRSSPKGRKKNKKQTEAPAKEEESEKISSDPVVKAMEATVEEELEMCNKLEQSIKNKSLWQEPDSE